MKKPVEQLLSDAKGDPSKWALVAGVLSELEGGAPSEGQPPPIEVVSALTGFSGHRLRQMQRAWKLVEAASDLDPKAREQARALPLSHAELLTRIASLDRSAALKVLESPQTPTIRTLRELYSNLQRKQPAILGSRSAGHRAMHAFRRLVQDLVTREAIRISREHHQPRAERKLVIPWPGTSQYVSPSLAVATTSGSRLLAVDAILCANIRHADRRQLTTVMARAAFEAPFFDGYWIALPSGGDAAGKLRGDLHTLQLWHIGVLAIDESARTVQSEHAPEWRGPRKDLRKLLHLPVEYIR